MKRILTAIGFLTLVASCGSRQEAAPAQAAASAQTASAAPTAPPAPATDAPTSAETTAPAEEKPVTAAGNTMLRFFNNVLESDQPKTATFELQAPKLAMTEDKVWQVEQATAIAYGKDGSQTKFIAGTGQFDDNTKTAMLKDGVSVTLGTQKVELQDMTWTNDTRTATSEHPVTVTDGETNLKAERMEYHAETKTLLLHKLSGTVSMKEAKPQ